VEFRFAPLLNKEGLGEVSPTNEILKIKNMFSIFLVAIGGALGSVVRYLTIEIFTKFFGAQNIIKSIPTHFPWPIFCINIIGSLLAGILYYFMIKYFDSFDVRMKNLLLVGVLGGFTTFSTFSLDFFRLFTAGHVNLALVYAISSVTISILALFFGFYLTKIIFS
jgi:fluoride exporter